MAAMASRASLPSCAVRRWGVFASGFVIVFLMAANQAYSVFSQPLADLRGWDLVSMSTGFSLYVVTMGIFGILGGFIVDRFDPRLLIYGGAVFFGSGWYLLGTVTSIELFNLSYVIMGIGCGLSYNPSVTTTLRWFPDIRGKIAGALLASAALGPTVLAPLINFMIDSYGVSATLHYLGVGYGSAMAAVGWLMRSPAHVIAKKKRAHQQPVSDCRQVVQATVASNTGADRRDATSYTSAQMLRTPAFWLMFSILAIGATAANMMAASLSNIAQFQVGAVGALSATAFGAAIISVYTMSNLVGRLVSGVLIDNIGHLGGLFAVLITQVVGLTALGFGFDLVVFVTAVVLLGLATGGLMVVFPPLTAATFGSKHSGMNYGIMFLGYSVAGFIGPKLPALFFDPDTTGFLRAYLVAGSFAAVGIVLVLVLKSVLRAHRLG